MRRAAIILAALLQSAICNLIGGGAAQAATLPPIHHVFIIVLENENANSTFGPRSKAPYLAKTLRAKGQFLPNYYGIAHESLANYIAMVSGQGPNSNTQSDCQFFTEFLPGIPASDGQFVGQGCVYPRDAKTVADQLEGKGLVWKGYMEDMANSPTEPKTCRQPAIGARDNTQLARRGDQYAARHNPFVYFHSIIDRPATCDANDVPLSRLVDDLRSRSRTAAYSFISPNLCRDGHDEPCVDGQPGGLVSANGFLREWVPRILRSPAFKSSGLLVITFDEAEAGGSTADSSACCNEQPGPNTIDPGGRNPGPGGGRTAAVVISRFVRPGSVNRTPYNHYALLRSAEDLFGLGHLGFAGQAGLKPFGADVYNARGGALRIRVRGVPKHGCARAFMARVRIRAGGLRSVRARVDQRVVFRKRRASFRVRVRASRLRHGVHRFRVDVRARGGRAHSLNHFRTC